MRRIANGTPRERGSPTLPILKDTSPSGVRSWIKDVCKSAGMTSTQLARAAGFPPATVNRFLNATKGAPKNLNAGTIATLQETAVRLLSPSASAQHSPGVSHRWVIRSIEVTGPVAANQWRSAPEWPKEDRYLWPAPIEAEYNRHFVVGLEVEDDSADLLYPVGAILTCVPFAELARPPRSGERVVVHRTNDDGNIEITIREYHVDKERRAWLLSRSSRPDITNIALGEHEAELPEGIAIPFRVTGSFIPE